MILSVGGARSIHSTKAAIPEIGLLTIYYWQATALGLLTERQGITVKIQIVVRLVSRKDAPLKGESGRFISEGFEANAVVEEGSCSFRHREHEEPA